MIFSTDPSLLPGGTDISAWCTGGHGSACTEQDECNQNKIFMQLASTIFHVVISRRVSNSATPHSSDSHLIALPKKLFSSNATRRVKNQQSLGKIYHYLLFQNFKQEIIPPLLMFP